MRVDTALAHPLIFPVLFLLFLLVGAGASYCMDDLGYPISLRLGVMAGAGLAAYVWGTRYEIRAGPTALFAAFIALVALMTYGEHGLLVLPTLFVLVVLFRYWDAVRAHAMHVAVAGIALLILNMAYIGHIPILNPSLRHASQTIPFVFGYSLAFFGGAVYYPEHRLKGGLLAGAVLLAVLPYGMRSYLLIFLLAIGIEELMLRRMSIRVAWAFAAVALLLVVGLGYATTYLLPQEWHLSGAKLVLYRAGFTTHMLDEACRISGWTGILHGDLWRNSATSPLVGSLVAGSGNITTTLLGPLVVDGGIIEMPLMAFAGATINTLYRRALSSPAFVPDYALVLSILIISIEISPVPLIFALFGFALAVITRDARADTRPAERLAHP